MTTRNDVYHDAGKALELAQLLETELGTALLALDALETNSFLQPNADAYLRLLEAIERHTLGSALRQIGKKLELSENLESLFGQALEARNFLAHRFYPHHGLAILTAEGCTRMTSHIDQFRDKLWPAYMAAQSIAGVLVTSVTTLQKAERDGRA